MYEIRIPVGIPTAWAAGAIPDARYDQSRLGELFKLEDWFIERFGSLRAAAVALATVADFQKKPPLAVLALLHASKEL